MSSASPGCSLMPTFLRLFPLCLILWLLVSDVLAVSIGVCSPEPRGEYRGVFKPEGLNTVTGGTWEINGATDVATKHSPNFVFISQLEETLKELIHSLSVSPFRTDLELSLEKQS